MLMSNLLPPDNKAEAPPASSLPGMPTPEGPPAASGPKQRPVHCHLQGTVMFNFMCTCILTPWLARTMNPMTRFCMVSTGGYFMIMCAAYQIRLGNSKNPCGGPTFLDPQTFQNCFYNCTTLRNLIYFWFREGKGDCATDPFGPIPSAFRPWYLIERLVEFAWSRMI